MVRNHLKSQYFIGFEGQLSQVSQTSHQGDEFVMEVAIRVANELGDHATGTVLATLPLD